MVLTQQHIMQLRGPAHLYYDAALQYLAHTALEELSEQERAVLAVDIALAALVGEGVYNFGASCFLHSCETQSPHSPCAWQVKSMRMLF